MNPATPPPPDGFDKQCDAIDSPILFIDCVMDNTIRPRRPSIPYTPPDAVVVGKKAPHESPLTPERGAEFKREGQVQSILHLLARYGPAGPEIVAGLAKVEETEKLLRLLTHASTCGSLKDFEQKLREELPGPPPASTRGKRRSRKPSN